MTFFDAAALWALFKSIEVIVGRTAKRLYGRLKNWHKTRILTENLDDTILEDVESFIQDYDGILSEREVVELRSIAKLRGLFKRAQNYVETGTRSQDAAETFVKLAKQLHRSDLESIFTKSGVRGTLIQDPEAGEEVSVVSPEYMVALLMRHAAATWTQLARELTPSFRGWALEQNPSLNIIVSKPSSVRTIPVERMDLELGRFRDVFRDAVKYSRLSKKILDYYLKAVSCLKSAQWMVDTISGKQQIHAAMNPKHLNSLAVGLRAESQYWLFNVSDHAEATMIAIREFENQGAHVVDKYLARVGAGKAAYQSFTKFRHWFDQYQDGLAGALHLYGTASQDCLPGKNLEIMEERIQELQGRASATPVYLVDEPQPLQL